VQPLLAFIACLFILLGGRIPDERVLTGCSLFAQMQKKRAGAAELPTLRRHETIATTLEMYGVGRMRRQSAPGAAALVKAGEGSGRSRALGHAGVVDMYDADGVAARLGTCTSVHEQAAHKG
jgi:hypothetical protein